MRFALVLAAVLAAPAAFAGTDRCQEPFGPVVPNGQTATAEEMKTAKTEVLTFISDSDVYQDCLVRVMDDPTEEMKEPQKKAVLKDISANQKEKETVAAAFNEAVKQFKARGLTLD
jgi:hypothetical protein